MSDFEKSILEIISKTPGIKARDIAAKLNCDKKLVNSALYGNLKARCYQDAAYKWYLHGQTAGSAPVKEIAPPDEKLASLCRYYLNCLSVEQNNSISAFLTSKYSLEYTELKELAVNGSDDKIASLIKKISAERNLTAHVGYPVLIEKIHSTKTTQDYLKVAPVFLFPVEISVGAVKIAPVPSINMEVIRQYSSRDIESQVYDLIELENELGLNAHDSETELDEVVVKLQSIRQWQWKEDLDPFELCVEPAIETISEEGIYNKAIFIISERSPYTVGLESELSLLAQMDEDSYRGTALYEWIHGMPETTIEDTTDATPLLEVLPMNSEQEQAIRQGLSDNLTIVTGPPGTGKSQVATNLLINAAWTGKNTLFTSKNNKAVDVVEKRVNELGKRPVMLRIGNNQYAHRLAELIFGLLSYNADQSDKADYAYYISAYNDKLQACEQIARQKEQAISLRNQVDALEQKVCNWRDKLGEVFKHITYEDAAEFNSAVKAYNSAFDSRNKARNSIFGRLFWFIIGKSKNAALDNAESALNAHLAKYKQPILVTADCVESGNLRYSAIENAQQLAAAMYSIVQYKNALHELTCAEKPEDIDRKLIRVKEELSDIAENLWKKWLITRPLDIDATCRREMNEYISAMKLIGEVDLGEHPEIKQQFSKLQQKMASLLPCWAVTSLSAKGRIPFRPGLFDLVVIDEASQCDIASVLPMLFRAKRAVIIGDPKQLGHISTLSRKQDLSLTHRYNINMGWSYSAGSLYALANSMVSPEHIVQLKDHHRSFGDIIEFSNDEFYDGKLRIATDYKALRRPKNMEAGIRWIDISGKTIRPASGGAYNDAEVAAVVAELKRLALDNNYEGSIGVVTPFRAQADKIRNAVEKDAELYEQLTSKNDFLVDTVHKFQGDERDVMIFSSVISKGTSQGALGFLSNTGNLFNVAVTRARAVLLVVGDSEYCAACGVSYMEHFVSYVRKKNSPEANKAGTVPDYAAYNRAYPTVANPEQVSDWERIFYTALYDSGIKTIPQYPVDKYKLDLAIIKGERKLDIEVDGEMYHKDWNGELSYRDQLRNQRLFELGWDVKRFWVYQIRDDLEGCIAEVEKWSK